MKYIVNFSGGKDSTAMLFLLLEKDYPIDYIVNCDTGKEFPEMYAHIEKVKSYLKKYYPNAPEITTLRADHSFDYYMFDTPVKRKGDNTDSQYNKSSLPFGYGWASFRNRWCTSRMKTRVTEKFCKGVGDDCKHYIGIAADEPERIKPSNLYPLVRWGITEADALEYCYKHGFDWGGLYEHTNRVSCWCCPLQSIKSYRALWKYHSELWAELKQMDARSPSAMCSSYTLDELEKRFEIEALQMNLFEDLDIHDKR